MTRVARPKWRPVPHPTTWPTRTRSGRAVTHAMRDHATAVARAIHDGAVEPAPTAATVRALMGDATHDVVDGVVELVAAVPAWHVVGQEPLPLDLTTTHPNTTTRRTAPASAAA